MMRKRFTQAVTTVSGLTGLSRIFGFVRDQLLAALIGPGVVLDAWFAAFRIPNIFRRIFAEGAMSAAFVPLLQGKLNDHGPVEAKAFARAAFSLLFLILTPVIVALVVFMPWIMGLITGFKAGSISLTLAILFGRIMLPYLMFMSLMALIGGVLDALGRFAPKAFAPTLLNIVLITVLFAIAWFDLAPGIWLSWATLFAGLAQLLIVWIPAARLGWAPALRWPRGTGIFFTKMIPGLIANGSFQLSSLIVLSLASSIERDLSHLYFADRIYQLPLGLIGIALNTVLLSSLSGLIAAGKDEAARIQINRGLGLSLLLAIPITLTCLFHGEFLFQGLFQVGQFTAADVQGAGHALIGYALGIPAAVGQKVLQPAFFARHDTRTPMIYALLSVAVAVGLSYGLYPHWGLLGLGVAASIAAWVGFLALAVHLYRAQFFRPDWQFAVRLIPLCLASGIMLFALQGILGLFGDFANLGFAVRLPLTLGLIGLSAVLYFALVFILNRALLNKDKSALF